MSRLGTPRRGRLDTAKRSRRSDQPPLRSARFARRTLRPKNRSTPNVACYIACHIPRSISFSPNPPPGHHLRRRNVRGSRRRICARATFATSHNPLPFRPEFYSIANEPRAAHAARSLPILTAAARKSRRINPPAQSVKAPRVPNEGSTGHIASPSESKCSVRSHENCTCMEFFADRFFALFARSSWDGVERATPRDWHPT